MLNATYKVTSDPAREPISLAELKKRIRITTCDFDDELQDLLISGRQAVEYDARRYLITQSVELYLDRFPSGTVLEIRRAPVSAVASVQYVDEDQATQTYASSRYSTDLDSTPPRIILTENEDWEDTEPSWPHAVTVSFTGGYGLTPEDVPVEARLAIVEWVRMNWSGCDHSNGGRTNYDKLIDSLAWSAVWRSSV